MGIDPRFRNRTGHQIGHAARNLGVGATCRDLERAGVRIDARYGALLQELVEADVAKLDAHQSKQNGQAVRQLQVLREKRRKLLDAYYAGAITVDMLKTDQVDLTTRIEALELKVSKQHADLADIEFVLKKTLEFLYNPHATYLQAAPALRKQLNQAVFARLDVVDDESTDGALNEPFASLTSPDLVTDANMQSREIAAWGDGAPAWLEAEGGWATAGTIQEHASCSRKQQTRSTAAAGLK